MSFNVGKELSNLVTSFRTFSVTLPFTRVRTLFSNPFVLYPFTRGFFAIPMFCHFSKAAGVGYNEGGSTNFGLFWGAQPAACVASGTFVNSAPATDGFVFGAGSASGYLGSISPSVWLNVSTLDLRIFNDVNNFTLGTESVRVDAVLAVFPSKFPW